jgi:hypothetical protein
MTSLTHVYGIRIDDVTGAPCPSYELFVIDAEGLMTSLTHVATCGCDVTDSRIAGRPALPLRKKEVEYSSGSCGLAPVLPPTHPPTLANVLLPLA